MRPTPWRKQSYVNMASATSFGSGIRGKEKRRWKGLSLGRDSESELRRLTRFRISEGSYLGLFHLYHRVLTPSPSTPRCYCRLHQETWHKLFFGLVRAPTSRNGT